MSPGAQDVLSRALRAAPLLFFAACSPHSEASHIPEMVTVQVVDAVTDAPIESAVVTASSSVSYTDGKGIVRIEALPSHLAVRATGHHHVELEVAGDTAGSVVVHLPGITPKALYLSVYGIGDRRLRGNALKLLDETELNAVVIDVKGDRGHTPYSSKVALAATIGAQRLNTVRDMPKLIASLHAQGVYAVARIVTFKDNLLARSRPEWAVHTRDGALWIDSEGLAWCDPFREEVWSYNIDIAEEAARMGFDEIQFDYVRFPDETGLAYARPSTQKSRVAAVTGFLEAATKRLEPYNVFLAADVFGYVLWNKNDTSIGQRLEDLMPHLDYLSPMLYPSGFHLGVPGYRDPVAYPYETVILSLRNGQQRTRLPAARFRPWLQAFQDYAYGHRGFGGRQIADQIKAAEEFGSDGWMLWNPRNVYTADGLKKKAR